ncbi:MAG: UbiX family flavin prenyltransferase [Pseudomonadales bacterium]|nr:UbiX family flavin prenyltransferase [Pseudomonadales bacterium]
MAIPHYCVALTGASGFVYAKRLLQCLLQQECVIHVLVSSAAREVARLEHDCLLPDSADALACLFEPDHDKRKASLKLWSKTDWLSPVASGSHPLQAMVVCPCSTGTLSAIANGHSTNLIERAATVCLKEQRKLILLPREMPLGAIQLEHMHKLAQLGVVVMPASPGFYHKPESINDLIDFVVSRILQQLSLPAEALLMPAWGEAE